MEYNMFLLLFSTNLLADVYKHTAKWEYIPEIISCGNNAVDVNFIHDSLKYWLGRGYEFGKVNKYEKCPKEMVGKIIIKNELLVNTKEEGTTRIQLYAYRGDMEKEYIDYALIRINQYSSLSINENQDTLTHEMGHALGIEHTHKKEDIMYPYIGLNQYLP